MEQIKDQQRLFAKLFMSPHSCEESDLLLSIQFLRFLLEQSHELTTNAQKQLLIKVLEIFKKQPINSLLLYSHDQASPQLTPLLTLIVMGLSKIIKTAQEIEDTVSLLTPLLSSYPISLLHISAITKQLSLQFHQGRFNSLRNRFFLSVLDRYYKIKQILDNVPQVIFFFPVTAESCAIRNPENTKIPLKNELAIIITLCIQKPLKDGIIWMATNHQSLSFRIGKWTGIENQSTGNSIGEEQQFQLGTWHTVLFNLGATQTSVYLNGQEIIRQKKNLLKREKQRQLRQYIIGQNFIGSISSFFVLDKIVPQQTVAQFTKLHRLKQISRLYQKKLNDAVVLSCLPYLTFKVAQTQHCFDIFRKFHSPLGDSVIIFDNQLSTIGISYLGGYQLLLPLFYMARFYNHSEDQDHLQRLLKILSTAIQSFKDLDNLQDFFLILGHHLENLPELLTSRCVILLSNIYDKLSTNNKLRFLRHVGWNGLPGKSNNAVAVKQWLNWLTKLYQNNKSDSLRSYGLMDVVFWLVKYLQNSEQNCCPEHYVNQARALREFSFDQLSKIQSSSKKKHFQSVQNIAAVILQYEIIDSKQKAVRSIKAVLRLLLHRYSNCLYSTILNILKRQYIKFRQDRMISQMLQQANIMPFLAALAQKVVDHKLLALILYFMLMVSQFSDRSRTETVDFYIIVFLRLKKIHHQHFNLLAHGAKKVRKRSLDDTSNVSQSLPDLLLRLRAYRNDFSSMQFLLVNLCLGVVQQTELCGNKKFIQDKGFTLIYYLFDLSEKKLKIDIMCLLKQKLLSHPSNMQFCQHSLFFTKLLLQVSSEEVGYQILGHLIESQLNRKVNLGDYYIQFKNCSRSQIPTAPLFIACFTNLFTKNYKFTLTQLYQILLILSNQTKHQPECNGYWNLMGFVVRQISQTIKYHILSFSSININTSSFELIDKVRTINPTTIHGAHFDLQVASVCEQQVNFLFDILLPKLIARISTAHLLQDIRRPVYVFEIYLWKMMRVYQIKAQHEKQRKEIAHQMVQVVLTFCSTCILQAEQDIDKSFMRMVVFMVSHFLYRNQQIQDLYILWNQIIIFTRDTAIKNNLNSYSQCSQKLLEQDIQPFYIQMFQTFLRTANEDYIIPFSTLKQLNDKQQIKEIINKNICPILDSEQFPLIFETSEEYAIQQLYKQYQQKFLQHQQKIDAKQKLSKQNQLFLAVQKIFQQQSIGQEQTRLKFLHQHQNWLRQYHSSWDKLWKRLRIYHHPYSIFQAQKDQINTFLFNNPLKNYRYRVSEYSSCSGMHPILQAEILQPWHVRKTLQQENKNQITTLAQLLKPDQAKPKKQGVIHSFTNLLLKISGQYPRVIAEYQVLWIKQGRKARGKLTLNDKDQLVFWYESIRQQDSHLSFEKFTLPYNEPMVKSWRVDYIKKVSPKRYLMKKNTLQFILNSRKTLLFHFEDQRQLEFLNELQKIRVAKIQNLGPKLKQNKISLYSDGWQLTGLSQRVMQDWRTNKISNLEYLLALNRAASRGQSDMSQYPVFPWVCQMKEQKQPTLRDLTKTMGGLGSEDRKRIVAEKYAASDPFNPVPPFHFGTHYSSPGVVFNFLIRLAPFTEYCKNLQGGKFDIADRLFASIVQVWRSAWSQVSDVRELIPQFYYLPQSLINLQRLHLGETQSGEDVDHVELPPWAASNPYFFIAQMRQMLESQQVSSAINHWIDLLFGIKQRGQAARENYNIYYYLTYEEYSDSLKLTNDQVYRKSCEAQIVHFGQIPPQIFDKQHPKRVPKVSRSVQLRVIDRIQLINGLKQKLVGAGKTAPNQLTLIKRNFIETLSLTRTPAALIKTVQFNFQRTKSKQAFALKKEDARVLFFKQYFVIYGYNTNEFRVINRATGASEFDDSFSSKILCCLISEDESLVLFGCASGMLYIYQLEYDVTLKAKQVHSEVFQGSIVHISQFDGYFTISWGCHASIYQFERSLYYLSKESSKLFVRFYRSFRNNLPLKGAFLADQPLYCILLYDHASIKIYSVNGQLIKVIQCTPRQVFPLKDGDLNSLFCVQEQNRLLLLSTPDLRCVSQLQIGKYFQIFKGIMVSERDLSIIGC